MTLYAYSTAKKFGSQSKKTSLTKNCIKKFCKDTGVRFTKVKYKTHVGTLKVDFSSLRSFPPANFANSTKTSLSTFALVV